jgi:competence protein ComEC
LSCRGQGRADDFAFSIWKNHGMEYSNLEPTWICCFMMLWLNPYVIQNIGFQLSFLAIAGILLFAKPIIRSLSFKSKILHWTWEIVSLSLAAQVFIVPILLRQFHQFPLTFIISSIVAIPAGYLIIVGALVNVLLSFLGLDFLWIPLDLTTHYFIKSMQWMAGLNPAMNYSMTPAAGWLIFLMSIVFSAAWL